MVEDADICDARSMEEVSSVAELAPLETAAPVESAMVSRQGRQGI